MSRAFITLRADPVMILHEEKSRQRVGFISENTGSRAQISSSDNPLSRVCALSRVLHALQYTYLNTNTYISTSICILIAYPAMHGNNWSVKKSQTSVQMDFHKFFQGSNPQSCESINYINYIAQIEFFFLYSSRKCSETLCRKFGVFVNRKKFVHTVLIEIRLNIFSFLLVSETQLQVCHIFMDKLISVFDKLLYKRYQLSFTLHHEKSYQLSLSLPIQNVSFSYSLLQKK